ncbi:MAG: aminotransferase class I/II-fold pyridoxal phosphate-dependent enzyme, partial [Muribaculaceae bacterium]|nr:aminotransferase class I/II-fold pyridoxal phosphate-dependent enzyme [Muribaculaceae bacterium]
MRRFDFDALTERRNTGSMKWDTLPADDIIPLWVADMDFRTAPVVTEALRHRVDAGIFGYTDIPSSYYDAVCGWFSRRHGWYIDRGMMIVTSGVVPAISAVIKALTIAGDGVILQTPAYNCFFSSVRNNGCREYDNRLVRISEGAGFSYEMDFENLENLASDPRNKLLILCNPHNPTGRVWTRSELERVRDICRRHRVRVVSDEIHCELTHPGFDYIPYATVDDHAVVCGSPSKAFNIAGLQN